MAIGVRLSAVRLGAPTPAGAIVLLLSGGLIGLLFVTYIAVLSLGALGACFGRVACGTPGTIALAVLWGLLLLAMATGVYAVMLGLRLRSTPGGHRLRGAVAAGLAVATLLALGFLLRTALVYVLVLFGGWCLILVAVGGILAVVWTPSVRAGASMEFPREPER